MKPSLLICLALVAGCATTKAPAPPTEPTSAASCADHDHPPGWVQRQTVEDVVLSTDPHAPLPLDPNVRTGRLDNGLTWYIEPNEKPADRVELRLVVRAGSAQEAEDQQGLAHVVEHMAFNGTEHFPGTSLVRYLESIGAKMGAHMNAYTSFEETVYKLQVPTDEPELLDKGFLVLRDWAGGLTFEPEEIEKERGVVLEEWRGGRDVWRRRTDATRPLIYQGAPHSRRPPIGTKESLESFTHEALERFYDDWYRPELMAVIVVGDMDPDDAQRRVERMFGDLVNGPDRPPRPHLAIPRHDETLMTVFTDPEMSYSSVRIGRKIPDAPDNSHLGFRKELVERLWSISLNDRFTDLEQDPRSPFHSVGVSWASLNPHTAFQYGAASAKDGRAMESLSALLVEVERARRWGLVEDELERAKRRYMAYMRSSYAERDTQRSWLGATMLLENFTEAHSVPGTAYEWALVQKLLPEIALAEVNQYGAQWMRKDSRHVLVSLPSKEGGEAVSERDVRKAIEAVENQEITMPEEEEVPDELMATLPKPGRILKRHHEPAYDATVLTLSNGATVIYKQTDFKADSITFDFQSWGGYSVVPDHQRFSARTALSIADDSGVGTFTAPQLRRHLAGKSLIVWPYMRETYQGVAGDTTVADLETALQLVHLYFVAPRIDDAAFEIARSSMIEGVRNRDLCPTTRFSDRFRELVWQGHPSMMPTTLDEIEGLDLQTSRAFLKRAFSGVKQGAFVFVGALEPERFEPLVERYLASLPTGEKGGFGDVGKRYAKGVHTDTVHRGIEPKARIRLQFHGEFENTAERRHELDTLGDALSMMLREKLREEMGGTYSVGAWDHTTLAPEHRYAIRIDFECDPARVEEMRAAVMGVVESVLAGPIDPSITQRLATQSKRRWETAVRDNDDWLTAISSAQIFEEPPSLLLERRTWSDRITPEYVHAAAKSYIDLDRYVMVTLLPQREADAKTAKRE